MALIRSGAILDISRKLTRLSIQPRSYSSSSGAGFGVVNTVPCLGTVFSSNPSNVHSSVNQGLGPGPQQALLLGGVRFNYSKRPNLTETRRKYKDDETAQHYHGFTYFPRFPDKPDPPIQPSKLFAVKRIRSLYGCPHWEKKMMRELGLLTSSAVTIVKNTPMVNKTLYKVKHLVEITPITMPYGMPDKPENGFLKENGEFISYNPVNLHGVTLEDAELQLEDYVAKHLDQRTVKIRMHKRWHLRYDIV